MPSPPPALRAEISTKTKELAGHEPATAGPLWGALHKLLLKAKVDPGALAHLVASRDLTALERLVRSLHGEVPSEEAPGVAPQVSPEALPVERTVASDADAGSAAPGSAAASVAAVDQQTLESALRAFRKRLKLTRLDRESTLSVRPLTSGRKHEVDAIVPPREFPLAVWEALVARGRLTRAGQGFYALAEEHSGQ